MTREELQRLAAKADSVGEVTGQMLCDAGFNVFAAQLLAESYVKKGDKSGSLCFTYKGFEITFGPNLLRPLITALIEDREALRDALRFYQATSRIPMEATIDAYNSGDTTLPAYLEYTKFAREALAASDARLAKLGAKGEGE